MTAQARKLPLKIWLFLVFGLFLVVGYIYSGAPTLVGARVASVQTGELTITQECNATVVYRDSQSLVAQISGTVEAIEITNNAAVQKGQVLVRLRNPDIEAAVTASKRALDLAKAQAKIAQGEFTISEMDLTQDLARKADELKLADVELASTKELVKSGVISRLQLLKLQAVRDSADRSWQASQQRLKQFRFLQRERRIVAANELEQVQADLTNAIAKFEALTIRAPKAGKITRLDPALTLGSAVLTNQLLLEMAESKIFGLQLDVPSDIQGQLNIGGSVSVQHNGQQFTATIREVSPIVQEDQFKAIADFNALPPQLSAGTMLVASIALEQLKNVLYVELPEGVRSARRAQLFVAPAKSDQAVVREVVLGPSSGKYAVVTEGLQVGEFVVLNDTSAFQGSPALNLRWTE